MSDEQNETEDKNQPTGRSILSAWSGLGLAWKIVGLVFLVALAGGLLSVVAGEDSGNGVDHGEGEGNGRLVEPKSKTVVETDTIAYGTQTEEDPKQPEHVRTVRRAGVVGTVRITYKVFEDGRKIELKRRVLKDPVDEIVTVGIKGKALTKRSWSELKVSHFTEAPAKDKKAIADKYLNEKKLKKPGRPWQDPNWLVGEMDRWARETADSGDKRLDWELGYRIADFEHDENVARIEKIEIGTSIEDVRALLGEPSASREIKKDGSMIDYLYYGPVGDRAELVFSGGVLTGKSR